MLAVMEDHECWPVERKSHRVMVAKAGIDQLEVEMEGEAARHHSGEGDVSLVVRTEKPL